MCIRQFTNFPPKYYGSAKLISLFYQIFTEHQWWTRHYARHNLSYIELSRAVFLNILKMVNVDSYFEENNIHEPAENGMHSKYSILQWKILFIVHSCMHLSTKILRSHTHSFLELSNTSYIEHLLNTYYSAGTRNFPETNKQMVTNTLGSHN